MRCCGVPSTQWRAVHQGTLAHQRTPMRLPSLCRAKSAVPAATRHTGDTMYGSKSCRGQGPAPNALVTLQCFPHGTPPRPSVSLGRRVQCKAASMLASISLLSSPHGHVLTLQQPHRLKGVASRPFSSQQATQATSGQMSQLPHYADLPLDKAAYLRNDPEKLAELLRRDDARLLPFNGREALAQPAGLDGNSTESSANPDAQTTWQRVRGNCQGC